MCPGVATSRGEDTLGSGRLAATRKPIEASLLRAGIHLKVTTDHPGAPTSRRLGTPPSAWSTSSRRAAGPWTTWDNARQSIVPQDDSRIPADVGADFSEYDNPAVNRLIDRALAEPSRDAGRPCGPSLTSGSCGMRPWCRWWSGSRSSGPGGSTAGCSTPARSGPTSPPCGWTRRVPDGGRQSSAAQPPRPSQPPGIRRRACSDSALVTRTSTLQRLMTALAHRVVIDQPSCSTWVHDHAQPRPSTQNSFPSDRPAPSTARPPDRRRHRWRQRPQPSHLRRLIVPRVRRQVEMEPVPPGPHAGPANQLQIRPDTPPTAAAHGRRSPRAGSSPSPRPRTGPWPADRRSRRPPRRSGRCPGRSPRPSTQNRLPSGSARTVTAPHPGPIGGRGTELGHARDQLRLMGHRRGGEIEVHAVLHRLVRDADDIDADGGGVRPGEAHGFDVGHPDPRWKSPSRARPPRTGPSAAATASLHIHLHKSQRHPLILNAWRPDAMNLPEAPAKRRGRPDVAG